MKTICFISGLGADQRVFERLQLPSDYRVVHLPWLEPTSPSESIEAYAKRMSNGIENPSDTTLVGLSFGGVMAIEISKILALKQIILVSSIKTEAEMPPWLKFIGQLGIHRAFPTERLLQMKELGARFFGCNTVDQREMLDQLFDHASPSIVAWSVNQLLLWNNASIPSHLTHIHGTADSVFPKAFCQPDHWIEDGPHFMIYSHPKEVSALLKQLLN